MKTYTTNFTAKLKIAGEGHFRAEITEEGNSYRIKIYRKYLNTGVENLQNKATYPDGDIKPTLKAAKDFVRNFVPKIKGRLVWQEIEKED